MEDGFFNFDSDCDSPCIDNQGTIEKILREVCMVEDCYRKQREKMVNAMKRSAACQFLVGLKETEDSDFIGLYFFDGERYLKLLGDDFMPKVVKDKNIEMRLVYDSMSNTLINTKDRYPDAVILS